jgi:hypothetical protein
VILKIINLIMDHIILSMVQNLMVILKQLGNLNISKAISKIINHGMVILFGQNHMSVKLL